MNLYLISQDQNEDYDTFDSAVVAAESEKDAAQIHPACFRRDAPFSWEEASYWDRHTWCDSPDAVTVKLIGNTDLPRGVVLASFNAG